MQLASVIIVIAVGVITLSFLGIFLFFLRVWLRALTSGNAVPLTRLVGMKLRRVPPGPIVDCHIRASQAGLEVTLDQLERHYLAGGRPDRVVEAMVRLRNRDIAVPFAVVAKTDLAGFNLDEVDPEEIRKAIGQSSAGR